MEQKIGANYREHAAVEYHLKAGQGVVLDVGQSLTLKAAGSSVVLDETGVSVTGLMVLINSGGGAGSAKSASASAPKTSEPVDPGHAGNPIPPLGAEARFKNAPVEFEPAAFSAIEKPEEITPAQGDGFGSDDALSLSLDLMPFVGTGKGIIELAAGFDPMTGEAIPRWISAAGLAASIIPGGKAAVRGARAAGKMAKHADEAADMGEAVVKHTDEVADVSEAAAKSGEEVGQVAGTKSGAGTMYTEVVPNNNSFDILHQTGKLEKDINGFYRTSDLGTHSSISELMQSGALPGSQGATLTDRTVRFGDLYDLGTLGGRKIEFALTTERVDGKLVKRIYSGDDYTSPVPRDSRLIGHVHPNETSTQMWPSPEDMNIVNARYFRELQVNPEAQAKPTRVFWGSGNTDNTIFYPGFGKVPNKGRQ